MGNFFKSGRESGSGLVGAMIGVGIVGLSALAISQMTSFGLKGQTHLRIAGDREALKRMVLDSVNCGSSLTPTTCPTTGFVTLKRLHKDGTVTTLATNTGAGTKIGRWTLRGECSASGDGLVIRTAALAPTGNLDSIEPAQFLSDPLTNAVVTWSDPRSLLFEDGIELCSATGGNEVRSESSNGALIAANACSGSYVGGWCSGGWYRNITFAKAFESVPTVMITGHLGNTQGACGSTSDRAWTQATNITKTGFKLICTDSPIDCSPYGGWWLYSSCAWAAIGK